MFNIDCRNQWQSPQRKTTFRHRHSRTRKQVAFDCLEHLLNNSRDAVAFQSLNANSDHRRCRRLSSCKQRVEVRIQRHHYRTSVSTCVQDRLVGGGGQSQSPNMYRLQSHVLKMLDGRTRQTLVEQEIYHAS